MAEEKTVTAPAARSQPSRKSKRAWRKNIDLEPIESGLEELQGAKILHGNTLPSEKDASELFATDTVGDEGLAKKHLGNRRMLKAEEILARRSKVPALDGRKRKTEEQQVGRGKRMKNGAYVTHKQLQHLRDVADGKSTAVVQADEDATHDPWADLPVEVNPNLSFIEQAQAKQKREPKTLREAPAALTQNGKRLPHVLIPDAGKSYNPLVGDWSALLEREGAAAVEAEKKRLAAEAAEEERIARAIEEAARVDAAEKDLYATDYDSAWESEWDGFLSGAEEEVFTKKQAARKTQAERNKIKARKTQEAKIVHERKLKEREQQERRIKQIAKEVAAKDKARQAHARSLQSAESSDSEAGDVVELRRRRRGKPSVPEAPLEIVLPDELEDSLRRLKPEGDLIQERYRNLLINGKVEVRKKVGQRKQRKTTRSEKWSYKDWKLR